MSSKKTAQNRQAGIRVLILLAALVCLNMLAARFHAGLDLTSEKRFTLTDPTKRLLSRMDDYAVIDVLLEGDNFPAGFQRLQESVRERLQSFRDASGGKVVFSFRDPFAGKTEKQKAEIFEKFAAKGVFGVNIKQGGNEQYSEQIVFPYAILNYKGKEKPIKLLERHLGYTPLEQLNYSETQLEYKIASAINSQIRPDKPRIAYLMGQGEALGWGTWDGLRTLQEHYHVDTVDLNSGTHIPIIYDAAIVCKPTQAFDDKAKFKLDQYVMNGGRLLMLLDAANASMDSLRSQQYLATGLDLNLDDLLFKWGVRVNPDLIEDLQSNRIPVMVGDHSEKHNWFYAPVFIPTSKHPIVRNMDGIMGMYVSTIDTVANPEIRKTILLESSQYSRPTMTPARISLSMLRFKPRQELYNKGYKPAAVLLEGQFQSVFQNRLPPEFLQVLKDSIKQPYKAQADSEGKVIVVSDGDVFLNSLNRKTGPYEMGYWDVDNVQYANKAFILNCMEYLTDNSGLLEARNKDVRLRLLDPGRAKTERNKWQLINIAVPLGLVLVFASAYIFFRRRKYVG